MRSMWFDTRLPRRSPERARPLVQRSPVGSGPRCVRRLVVRAEGRVLVAVVGREARPRAIVRAWCRAG